MDETVNVEEMILLTELRPLVIRWLKSVSFRRMANSLFGVDSPWATDLDLLPPGFPFADFVLPRLFRWTPVFSADAFTRRVTLEHSAGAQANATLGAFEIPPEVYDDPLRPFTVTAHLVLEGMLKSVAAHRTVGIMSHVASHSVGGTDYLVKHFDLVALPERIHIRQVAARWVKQCLYCATILAHPGPAGIMAQSRPPLRPLPVQFHSVEGDSGSGTRVGSIEVSMDLALSHPRFSPVVEVDNDGADRCRVLSTGALYRASTTGDKDLPVQGSKELIRGSSPAKCCKKDMRARLLAMSGPGNSAAWKLKLWTEAIRSGGGESAVLKYIFLIT
ncbi:hypothetical protein FB451DRAFT_1186299 [Mycena latifolia]|nr:hypothetical protein FB451DRAFT_1186299 [Mycena latifolia]